MCTLLRPLIVLVALSALTAGCSPSAPDGIGLTPPGSEAPGGAGNSSPLAPAEGERGSEPAPPGLTSENGGVGATLVSAGTGQPLAGIELVLFTATADGEIEAPLMAPPATTDAQGRFLFTDIPAGYYMLFSNTWGESWDDDYGSLHIFEVLPGQVLDLGTIQVDH